MHNKKQTLSTSALAGILAVTFYPTDLVFYVSVTNIPISPKTLPSCSLLIVKSGLQFSLHPSVCSKWEF